jgi:hypothetical protein
MAAIVFPSNPAAQSPTNTFSPTSVPANTYNSYTYTWNGTAWTSSAAGGGGTVTGVAGTAPIVSSGGSAPAISITPATSGAAGSMSAADKAKLDGAPTIVSSVTGTAPIAVATGTSTPAVSITPGAARQLLQTNAGATAVEFASNIDVPGTLDVTGTGTFDGDLKFNSGYGSAATAYGCRAWVNFNGTGVVAIRGSGNVSSVTDNGTGDYTVNFTVALPDANYSAQCMISEVTVYIKSTANGGADPSTAAFRMQVTDQPGVVRDAQFVLVSFFR